MFNVLTKDLKQNIESDYKKRKLSIWLFVFIFLSFFVTFTLVPSFVFMLSEKKSIEVVGDSVKNSSSSKEDEETKQIFDNTNKLLNYLSLSKPSFYTIDLLSKLIALDNSGIKMTDILYQRQSSTTAVFTLKGVAVNRESLILFSKNISSDNLFKDVNLPVSNFAKDKNIEFSFDVKVSI